MKALELSGQCVGRLVVIDQAPHKIGGHRKWNCLCECGNKTVLRSTQIKDGSTRSCGCLIVDTKRKELTKHGLYSHPSYKIWIGMKSRCFTVTDKDYPGWGGRGITICDRWLSVENFIADMGAPPVGLSIDRINNNGNYEPGNCRWATPKQQRANQRPRKKP